MLNEVYVWSKLEHDNVLKILGVTTFFYQTISIVSPLMPRGNAFDHVQNPKVDPRPLVCCMSLSSRSAHFSTSFRSWESPMD